MPGPELNKEWLGAAEVAAYLGIEPVTVYRWCRAGRLPCIKLGKAWRIRRAALEAFLRRTEQNSSLVTQLRAFYTIPDHVILVAETEPLLCRLEATFFELGEAYGGALVKFYDGKTTSAEQLRERLADTGLDVDHLEASERLQFVEESNPRRGRAHQLRQLLNTSMREYPNIWVTYNWTEQLPLEETIRQQVELASLVNNRPLVIQTSMLEGNMDNWSLATERRMRQIHRGAIWISSTGISMTRMAPLPAN